MFFKPRVLAVGNFLLFFCLSQFLMGSHNIPTSNPTLAPINQASTPTLSVSVQTVGSPYITYLPIVHNGLFPLIVGVYPSAKITQTTIDTEIKPLDNWMTGIAGNKSTSIVGTFIDMTVDDTSAKSFVETPLTTAWNNGYVTFINFPAPTTAFDLAAGRYDQQLISWAKSYKNFAAGGQRFAYLAPMQEMNGEWVTYGADPGNFKLAFKHIKDIFNQVGVPAQSVKWVFAPNGWSYPGLPRFEDYYPGDDQVDVVAISAYNWGFCKGAVWEEPETVFNNPGLGPTDGHYLDRLRAMAPSKPIFIAETASSSNRTADQKNTLEKDRWIKDAYTYLSGQKNVKAVLYFNFNKECDWKAYDKNGVQFQGYRTGVNANGYRYITPSQLMLLNHNLK